MASSLSERATAKREPELAEAQGHIAYFKNQRMALEFAIPKMQEDLRLCNKNVKIWEERIERMQEEKKE
jgi:hypothetical protein